MVAYSRPRIFSTRSSSSSPPIQISEPFSSEKYPSVRCRLSGSSGKPEPEDFRQRVERDRRRARRCRAAAGWRGAISAFTARWAISLTSTWSCRSASRRPAACGAAAVAAIAWLPAAVSVSLNTLRTDWDEPVLLSIRLQLFPCLALYAAVLLVPVAANNQSAPSAPAQKITEHVCVLRYPTHRPEGPKNEKSSGALKAGLRTS